MGYKNKTWRYPENVVALSNLLFLFLVSSLLHAQEVNIGFKHLSFEHGLSQNTVTAIIQDKKGFMWFGTRDGLCRYDGYAFIIHRFSADDACTLSDDYIQALHQDNRGVIWAGTRAGGLNRYDPVQDRFTCYMNNAGDPRSLSSDTVYFVYEDSRGILWVGTALGLNRFDRETETFYHYRHDPDNPASLSHDSVRCIAEDRSGILWVGTWSGLNRMEYMDEEACTFTSYRKPAGPGNQGSLPDDRVSAVCVCPDGNIYIGTEKGIALFNSLKGTFTRLRTVPGESGSLENQNINVLYPDTREHLWIGTHSGLYLFNSKTKKLTGYPYIPNMSYTLGNNQVNAIYKDRAGDLWIGIWADGLYHTDRSSSLFKTYRKDTDNPNSLSDSDITAIHREDDRGFFWIGTMKGLNRLDRENYSFKRYLHEPGNPGSLSHDEVSCIHRDHAGVLWIGTHEGGLNRFDRVRDRFITYRFQPGNPDSLSSDAVVCIYATPGGTLWIGTRDGGLNRMDADWKRFIRYTHQPEDPHSLSSSDIRTVYGDPSGALWIGTGSGGLNKFDPGTGHANRFMPDPQNPNSIVHSSVFSILKDTHGRFWIGTGGGLDLFDAEKEHFTHFTKEDGLPDNTIFGILEDENGSLWLSTGKGLSHFNPQNKTFKNYYWLDGLQSDEFNEGAFFKSKTGEMFFGGINGFNAFYPREITPFRETPPVVITGFYLSNRPLLAGNLIRGHMPLKKNISVTGAIRLDYKQNDFSLEFAALNYVYPGENRYAYKMENFDKRWNNAGKRNFAAYINMPPGKYTFKVKAANRAGNWNEEGASLKIIIIPPFWETLWFLLFLIILVCGLIYLFYRGRVSAIRRQQKKLERKVEERTVQLEIANRYKSEFLARMSHEIRTPMNSVIGFTDMLLDTKLNEEQENYARTIQHSGQTLLVLIDDILDLTRIEAGRLTFDPTDFDPETLCADVVRSVIPRLGQKPIELLLRIGDQVPAYIKTDSGRFRQVLLNLMGNAVKFTSEGEIELSLDVAAEEETQWKLHIQVRDTGIGIPKEKLHSIFEVFQQVDGSITRKYGGTGLGLAICKHIAGMMHGDVSVESTPGKGTTFHFIAYAEKSQKQGPPGIVPPGLAGKKVLIADKNSKNLDVLRHILTKAGMQVHGMSRGEGVAKELTAASRSGEAYDLCILDLHLPGMSGYDVLKEIRDQESPAERLPILAFSSSALARSRRLREAGFDDFLPRPAGRRQLLEKIARLLSQTGKNGESGQKETSVTRPTQVGEETPSIRILLVEDDPVNRKLAGSMLSKAGFDLDIVENGKEAVETYTKAPEKYDIILMDVQMPVMDGKEATRLIREKGFTDVPIIAVTADVMKGEREKLLETGMNDYISKPIKREVIYEKVKKWASRGTAPS